MSDLNQIQTRDWELTFEELNSMLYIFLALKYLFLPGSSSGCRRCFGPQGGCTGWGLTSGLCAMLTSFGRVVYRLSDLTRPWRILACKFAIIMVCSTMIFASWQLELHGAFGAQHLASTLLGVLQNLEIGYDKYVETWVLFTLEKNSSFNMHFILARHRSADKLQLVLMALRIHLKWMRGFCQVRCVHTTRT